MNEGRLSTDREEPLNDGFVSPAVRWGEASGTLAAVDVWWIPFIGKRDDHKYLI